MLLHPLQTYEQLKIIYDSIDGSSDMQQSLACYRNAEDACIRGAQGDIFVELGNAGMFNGLDSIYARVFYGERMIRQAPCGISVLATNDSGNRAAAKKL